MGNLKKLCEEAEKIDEVKNKEQLFEALPKLIEIQDAIASMNSLIRSSQKVSKAIVAACSKYALSHQSIFNDGLKTKEVGVVFGDLTKDNVTYHFVSGRDGLKRIDGENISQAFLKELPSEWVKTKLELDATGVNRAEIGDDVLAENGLKRGEKNVWSIAEKTS